MGEKPAWITLLPTSHKSFSVPRGCCLPLHLVDSLVELKLGSQGFSCLYVNQGVCVLLSSSVYLMLCSNLNPTTSEQSCTSLNGFIIGFEWSWPRRHLFVFGVTVGLNHCLQITFKHMPCGCEQVFLDWFPFFVYTSLSTGYKPAQHANMLWHFACRTDSDALSPPQAGLADILHVFSTHPTRNVEICYV